MRICSALICAIVLGVMPTTAAAQPRDQAAADALFQAARTEYDSGQYASACEKFAESNRLDPAPGTLLNLSLCLEKVGKVASAWEGFRRVAEQLRDERVEFATQRSSDLESRLPWVTLRLPPNAPGGTRVFRDGIELRAAVLGVALPVDPGPHVLVVEAPGRLKSSTEFKITEGQRLEVVLKLGLVKVAPTPESKPHTPPAHVNASKSESPDRTLAWISGGVGVAGITASLVTGALAMSSRSTIDDHCVDHICDNDGLDAASSGRTYATVSTVSGVIGFAGLGVSAYLFLSENREAPPTTLEAAALPGGGYVGMTRRF